MDAKLVVVGGDALAGEYPLSLPAVIGRSRTANIKVPQPLVSRRHCELYEQDGQLVVRDLGSLNGTFVGSDRISQDTVLQPGSLLTIGSITFQAVYVPAADTTSADDSADGTVDSSGAGQTIQIPRVASRASSIDAPAVVPDLDESPLELDDGQAGGEFPWLQDDAVAGLEPPQSDAVVQRTQSEQIEDDLLLEQGEHPFADEPLELDLPDEPSGSAGAPNQSYLDAALPQDLDTIPLPARNQDDDAHEFAPREGDKKGAADPDVAEEDDLDDFFRSLNIK